MTDLYDKVVYGCPDRHETLWRFTKDGQEECATEYNQEIMGYSEGLKDILDYGASAYYWFWTPAAITTKFGWTAEVVPMDTQCQVDYGEKKIMEVKHELKSWVGLFDPIFKGEKTHELRVLDRDYQIGDICRLKEYDPLTKKYTSRECLVEVTYITSSKHQECAFSPFALHPATGILSIKRVEEGS